MKYTTIIWQQPHTSQARHRLRHVPTSKGGTLSTPLAVFMEAPASDDVAKLAQDDIWHAARRGDAEAIESFIRRDVDVSAVDECGRTPGYYAGLYGHTSLAVLLRDFEARSANMQQASEGSDGGVPSAMAAPATRRVRHMASRQAAAAEGVAGAMAARVLSLPHEAKGSSSKKPRKLRKKFRKRTPGSATPSPSASPATTARTNPSPRSLASMRPLAQAGQDVIRGDGKDGEAKSPGQRPHRQRLELMRSTRERIRKKRLNEMVRRQQLEDLEMQKDSWMARRGMKTGFEFTREQKRELKRWFNFLDADGSGEINIEELEDPLLSTGTSHANQSAQL